MEIDTVLDALKDFESKGKKEPSPVLEQFLCHVAKTGETMVPWGQFKSYFLCKLEKVMDEFRMSMPEQRLITNSNVENIPFEETKERILKIVDGYNGIPFTIQRLCELLVEPKRNYTGTDKFLRGVEKNVMVVSCVYPTSEKNGTASGNKVNGGMFPGHSSIFSDRRNVNGPGTPRPLNRTKLSLISSLSTNGLPDCSVSRETASEEDHHVSDSSVSEGQSSPTGLLKNKHRPNEDTSEAERHEVKRLKFDEDEESPCPVVAQTSSDTPESSTDAVEEEKDRTATVKQVTSQDHEPSSTQTEPCETEEREAVPGSTHSLETESTMNQSVQRTQSGRNLRLDEHEEEESHTQVSSSSSSSTTSSGEGTLLDEPVSTSPCSTPESSTEGAAESNSGSPQTTDDSMHQV
ncbi:serine/threonine-protein phosphatase 4 regulatory subunit 2-A-like [Aplochiton taeniatus]